MGFFGSRPGEHERPIGQTEWLPNAPRSAEQRPTDDWGFDETPEAPVPEFSPAPVPEPAPTPRIEASGLDVLVDELRAAVNSGLQSQMGLTRDDLINAVRGEAQAARQHIRVELDAARAEIRADGSAELDRQVNYIREEVNARTARFATAAGAAAAEAAQEAATKAVNEVVGDAIAEATKSIEAAGRERLRMLAKLMQEEGRGRIDGEISRLKNEHEAMTREMQELAAVTKREMAEYAAGVEARLVEAESRVVGKLAETGEKLDRRARRQELKMVREEQSRRVEKTFRQLDERGEELGTELSKRVEAVTASTAGTAAARLEARIAEFEAKLDRARDSIDTDIRRAADMATQAEEDIRRASDEAARIGAVERRAAAAAAADAPDPDAPINIHSLNSRRADDRPAAERVSDTEAEAARRIEAAERTIRDLIVHRN